MNMSTHTTESVSKMVGEFTWSFGRIFFIETSIGNFLWDDPEYGGSGKMVEYKDTLPNYFGSSYGRSKGNHYIGDYCGKFTLVSKDDWDKIE